jgi:hypothetical protein
VGRGCVEEKLIEPEGWSEKQQVLEMQIDVLLDVLSCCLVVQNDAVYMANLGRGHEKTAGTFSRSLRKSV